MKKFKNLLMIMVIAILAVIVMPNKVMARTIVPESKDGDIHLWTTSDGYLHWDAVAGATDYKIEIYKNPGEQISDTISGITSTEYNLYGKMDEKLYDSGYQWRIELYANGAGKEEFLIIYYDSPYEKLQDPTGLSWSGNTATWNAVPNATEYWVYLEKTTTGSSTSAIKVTGTSVDLSSYSPKNGWYFTVVAKASGYRKSNLAESPRYGSGTRTIVPEETNGTEIHLWTTSDGYLHWDAVAGATDYTIEIYKHPGEQISDTISGITSTEYNLYGKMDEKLYDSGYQWRIELYANGAGKEEFLIIYYDSPYEKLQDPTGLSWSGNTATWNAVPNATEYWVYLEKTTTGSSTSAIKVTGTSVDLSSYSPKNGWYFTVVAKASGYRKSNLAESPRYSLNHSVTFNLNGGVWTDTGTNLVTVSDGSKVTEPSDPTKAGYAFVGWYADSGLTTEFDFDNTAITKDTTIYAKWNTILTSLSATITTPTAGAKPSDLTLTSGNPTAYTVELMGWYDSHGEFGSSETFEAGETYSVHIRFVANTGYQINNPATFTINGEVSTITIGTNEKGIYFAIPATNYTVTFDSNGGSSVSSQVIASGSKVTEPSAPTKTGYVFGGWYADSGLTTEFDFANIAITKDTTIYAKWNDKIINPISATITLPVEGAFPVETGTSGGSLYTIKKVQFYDDESNKLTTSDTFVGGKTYTIYVTFTPNAGYEIETTATATINGTSASFWSTISDGYDSKNFYINYTVPSTTNYTVTFDSNGGSSVSSQVIASGSKVTEPSDPTKLGYVFGGWYADSGFTTEFDFANKSITENTTIYAKWNEIITSVNVIVTAPVDGQKADFNPVPADSSKYTVTSTSWYLNVSPYPYLDSNSIFENGKTYALRVSVQAKSGYAFSESTIFTINGETTSCYMNTSTVSGREYTFTATEAPATTYTVSFDSNGGTGSMSDVTGLNGSYTLPSNEFTAPEGKIFVGWSLSASGDLTSLKTSLDVTGNKIVYAIWRTPITEATATITAPVGDAYPDILPVSGNSSMYSAGGSASLTEAKWKTGGTEFSKTSKFVSGTEYTIYVSYRANDGYVFVDDMTYKINGNAATRVEETGNPLTIRSVKYTFTATEAPVTTYKVSFDSNGGTGSMSDVTDLSGTYTLPSNGFTAPSGKQFKGWSLTSDGTIITTLTMDSNKTVYAIWENIPATTYTVSFDSNGGTGSMSDVTDLSGTYTLPSNGFTAPSGKQFKGWSLTSDGTIITTLTMDSNKIVYAIWENIPATTYTVSFDSNGGTGSMSDVTDLSGTYTLPSNGFTAPSGKQFKGWSLTSDGTIITTLTMDSNKTVYAIWEDIPKVYSYKYLSGDNKEFVKGKLDSYTFRIDGEFSKFDSVKIGDLNLVKDTDYTATEGSTIITFTSSGIAKLNTLTSGTHNVEIKFTGNTVIGKLIINNEQEENPNTKDEIISSVILGIASLISLAGGTVYLKRKKLFENR